MHTKREQFRHIRPLLFKCPKNSRKTYSTFVYKVRSKDLSHRVVFWDTSCSPLKVNRRFGGTCRLHLQVRRMSQIRNYREARIKRNFNRLHGVISQKRQKREVSTSSAYCNIYRVTIMLRSETHLGLHVKSPILSDLKKNPNLSTKVHWNLNIKFVECLCNSSRAVTWRQTRRHGERNTNICGKTVQCWNYTDCSLWTTSGNNTKTGQHNLTVPAICRPSFVKCLRILS
jgi:hypothetical protein